MTREDTETAGLHFARRTDATVGDTHGASAETCDEEEEEEEGGVRHVFLSQITARAGLTTKNANTSAGVSRPFPPSHQGTPPNIWLVTQMQLQGCRPPSADTSSVETSFSWLLILRRSEHTGRGCWNLSQHALGQATASASTAEFPISIAPVLT